MTDINTKRRDQAFALKAEAEQLQGEGFCTKAAQKRALENCNRAYSLIRDIIHDWAVQAARNEVPGWSEAQDGSDPRWQAYLTELARYDMPFDLHQVRAAHLKGASLIAPDHADIVRQLQDLRGLIKDTPVVPVVKDETKERVAAIRRDIIEIMESRKAQYVEALELGRKFGGLPVTVNAHWVRHEQGTVFLRHYFYLRGKLTPLQVIMAAADTLERERAEQEA